MKSLAIVVLGLISMFASGFSSAQNDNMMHGDGMHGVGMWGGMWGGGWMGGYYGYWGPILLVIVVGGVIWAILQRQK